MYLINGQAVGQLAVNDRAVQFGDGCFTTARIVAGDIVLFSHHLTRLEDACSRLAIPFNDWVVLAKEMRRLAQPYREGVLKVMITRGVGGRGYSAAGCHLPTRILNVSAYPAHYARWKETGIALTLSPVPLGRNPFLAGLKHLNRLEQVLIRSHLEQTDADEALVLDSEGWVTECCAANLFWRKGDIVFTPRLDQAGVNGIMRQFCLRKLAQSPFRVLEVQAREESVRQADEVIICNALMPIIPIRAYDSVLYSSRTLFRFLAPFCEHPN
ncbi:aminodeoxychorismate lyase [Salmonella enterica subsp. enterica]|nr:aminodeoxychorismate lyase [Salmonella enterica subsp. enterica]EDW9584971.1 aminodeoxychorismate lyase [Salmonella enterica subsp. enterica]EED9671895.1 aminodeoxychorismate lyase [Salmonella enterica subsp. enterica]EIO7469650.1 aminodeoxychorismate lyase [Salmonella enterica subsp. enterica]EIY5766404.1 aminodeoxychorismate lyase [Salmonella enterica subsp. enterica]